MKRCKAAALAGALILAFGVPHFARANMAAPEPPDIASAITFEQNDTIAVCKEVLDIAVTGAQADITASYRMQNTSDEAVHICSMFVAPHMEDGATRVTVRGENVPFEEECYALQYDTRIETDGWQYAVLGGEMGHAEDRWVETVTFTLDFAPGEICDVTVRYLYRLGGYPTSNFDAKRGELEYYLAPAAMWKDFSDLTINLYLDKDMPVLKESSLPFEKVAARTYRYTADSLPQENLVLVIDENVWQNFLSTLRSPYLPFTLLLFSPLFVLAVIVILILVIRHVRRKRRRAG